MGGGSKKKTPKHDVFSEEIPKFKKGDMKHKLVDVTRYEIAFPEYREPYLKESFPVLKNIMSEQGIKVELDVLKGSLCVYTSDKTWDPYSILLARDVINLISRHVPVEKAVQVFNEGITSEVVKIKNMCSKTDVFIKRRNRLIGKDNATLQVLESLTKCSVIVQGGTVCIIGPYKGVTKVMSIVKACMKNIHPLYLLNKLYIQKNLEKDPTMKNEDWSHLLPDYKPKAAQKKSKKKNIKKKKEYDPFPPAPLESKMDKQLEEGEYFLDEKRKQKSINYKEQKTKSLKVQKEKREKAYVVPKETTTKKRKSGDQQPVDLEKLKKKLKKHK